MIINPGDLHTLTKEYLAALKAEGLESDDFIPGLDVTYPALEEALANFVKYAKTRHRNRLK